MTLPRFFINGMEDLPSSNSDLDYNDMVVKISTASAAPEPASILLLGGGLLGFGITQFRRRKAAQHN